MHRVIKIGIVGHGIREYQADIRSKLIRCLILPIHELIVDEAEVSWLLDNIEVVGGFVANRIDRLFEVKSLLEPVESR